MGAVQSPLFSGGRDAGSIGDRYALLYGNLAQSQSSTFAAQLGRDLNWRPRPLMTRDKVRGRLSGDAADNIPFFYSGFAERVRRAEPGTNAQYV
jgi:hypothetical protein